MLAASLEASMEAVMAADFGTWEQYVSNQFMSDYASMAPYCTVEAPPGLYGHDLLVTNDDGIQVLRSPCLESSYRNTDGDLGQVEAAVVEAGSQCMPYCPGENLVKSAAYGSSTTLAVVPVDRPDSSEVAGAVHPATPVPAEQDTQSDCSTADTMGRSPISIGALLGCTPPIPLDIGIGTARPVLRLAEALPGPAAEPSELPSQGSAGHSVGQCKPCAFLNTKGCVNGFDCQFCHLCRPGEKKRRQKAKQAFYGAMMEMQKLTPDTCIGPVGFTGTYS